MVTRFQPGRRSAIRELALAGLLATTPFASACPFCEGGSAGVNEVRREVFGPEFWPHLLAAAAPFGVVLGVVAAVLWKPHRPGRG